MDVVIPIGITREMLGDIQNLIKETDRPHWCTAPPKSFGEISHGKLKADELRALFTFDLVVAVAHLLAKQSSKSSTQYQLFEATILLGIIIRIVTSRKTSASHANNYMKVMGQYLTLLRKLYPSVKLRPNHHMALHLGDFFTLLGPSRGWWMFPFERVNGALQNTPTNNKIGTKRALSSVS